MPAVYTNLISVAFFLKAGLLIHPYSEQKTKKMDIPHRNMEAIAFEL